MKSFLTAMKANPLTAAAALVALASVGVIVYYYFFVISARGTEIADAANKTLGDVGRLSRTSINIPAANPNQPPRQVNDVVNDTTIEKLETLYATLNGETEQIIERAVEFNRGTRPQTRMIRDDILPVPLGQTARIDARIAYRSAMLAMLGNTPWREGWPFLRAGEPLDSQTMSAVLDRHREDFIGTDLEKFEIEQRKSLKRALFFHTTGLPGQNDGISIYAQTDPEAQDFPLRIFDWANTAAIPTADQLWEAQLELWAVSDVVEAIMRTNRVGQTFQPVDSEGQPDGPARPFAVQEVPVKNLIELSVVPGYVGLHTTGAVAGGTTTRISRAATGGPPAGFDPSALAGGGFGRPARNVVDAIVGVYGGAPEVSLTGQGNSPVPENFYISPTGRASNAVFDVRHVRLVVDVDWLRLNELLDNLAEVNLITVLNINIQDIDERAFLAEGYHYGPHDVVRAEILLETLWMRQWTTPLMPDLVKTYLAVPKDDPRRANASRTIPR
ncbi:MAG: hypothetical protein AAF750_05410 [Planctomycetota bacterium]